MRSPIFNFSAIILAVFAFSASAEILNQDAIPEKITQHLLQKHPKAVDIVAEKTVHFGQDMIEVHYKENDVPGISIYRMNGNFHVAGITIAADDLMFATSKEALKKDFPEYKVNQAVLIPNANGAGEEFEVLLEAGGKKWDVSIDREGKIEKRELN